MPNQRRLAPIQLLATVLFALVLATTALLFGATASAQQVRNTRGNTPAVQPVSRATSRATPTERTAPSMAGSPVEAHHHLETIHHQNAESHLRALHHHVNAHATASSAIDRAMVLEHVRAVGEHLPIAKRHHIGTEHSMTPAQRAANRGQLDGIQADHEEATRHQQALETEAARFSPDARVLATHAAAAYHAVLRANEKHTQIRSNLGVIVSAVPPVPMTTPMTNPPVATETPTPAASTR